MQLKNVSPTILIYFLGEYFSQMRLFSHCNLTRLSQRAVMIITHTRVIVIRLGGGNCMKLRGPAADDHHAVA